MAKAKRRKKSSARARTPQALAFKRVVKSARTVCHAETTTPGAYRTCMSREMTGKIGGGRKRKAAASASKAKKCAGLRRKGGRTVLKKGYTWKGARRGGCPVRA